MDILLMADFCVLVSIILILGATEISKQNRIVGVGMVIFGLLLWVGPMHYIATTFQQHAVLIKCASGLMFLGFIVFTISRTELGELRVRLEPKFVSLLSIGCGYLVTIIAELMWKESSPSNALYTARFFVIWLFI